LSLADDFSKFFNKKRRNLLLLLLLSFISSDKFWQMVCLSCPRVSHCLFWQNDAGRGGQSLQMFFFTLIGHGARWEGTKLVHSTPSIIQGTSVNDRERGERVELFQHKKSGRICLVVEFRKNFETKK
jgi:hypothetical protein